MKSHCTKLRPVPLASVILKLVNLTVLFHIGDIVYILHGMVVDVRCFQSLNPEREIIVAAYVLSGSPPIDVEQVSIL